VLCLPAVASRRGGGIEKREPPFIEEGIGAPLWFRSRFRFNTSRQVHVHHFTSCSAYFGTPGAFTLSCAVRIIQVFKSRRRHWVRAEASILLQWNTLILVTLMEQLNERWPGKVPNSERLVTSLALGRVGSRRRNRVYTLTYGT
jgi:hypothetical protein